MTFAVIWRHAFSHFMRQLLRIYHLVVLQQLYTTIKNNIQFLINDINIKKVRVLPEFMG